MKWLKQLLDMNTEPATPRMLNDVPHDLLGEIIELSPATITAIRDRQNPNRIGMLVESDVLKWAHNDMMPTDTRGKKLLDRIPGNAVVALERVGSVDGRFRII